jgi:hypothetical protein
LKSIAAYLFLSLYLISGFGITINYHYCMGELVELKLYAKVYKCCGEPDETPYEEDTLQDGCCALGSIFLFSDSDYTAPQLTESSVHPHPCVAQSVITITPFQTETTLSEEQKVPEDPLFRPSTFLLNCSFIFYA